MKDKSLLILAAKQIVEPGKAELEDAKKRLAGLKE